MSKSMKLLGKVAVAAACLFVSTFAFASHKSWVLQHAGGQCTYNGTSPETGQNGAGDYGSMFLWNSYSGTRTAECPLIAANRWGSSGDRTFSPNRWAEAKSAFVHVYEGSSSTAFTCQAVARLRLMLAPGGALYFGTARSVSGIGNHTLELINSQSWGGSLEANEQAAIRSIDFQCSIPPGSAVRGYGAKLCQNWADCTDEAPRDDFQENSTYVQGNGADCTSWSLETARGADGLTINGTGGDLRARVVCPVLPPALDSYEHSGFIKRTRLYVAGGTPGPGCETNGKCPACYFEWETRDGGVDMTSNTFTWNSNGYLELPGQLSMTAIPSAVSISCLGYKGQRIRGYTLEMSETRVSLGQ
jgi:hypothetical protein